MSVDAKFIRDIEPYFKYPTDENPTTQQAYQDAVRNWVKTEEGIVDSHLWQPTTNYDVGNQVRTPSLPSQYVLSCTTAGTSGDGEPDYTDVAVGDSVITVTGVKPDGFKYVWKAASGTAPAVAVGTALTSTDGWAELPASGLISTTNGYAITVALVSAASGQPIAKGTGTVVAKAS